MGDQGGGGRGARQRNKDRDRQRRDQEDILSRTLGNKRK
jgi:hypothetical protein